MRFKKNIGLSAVIIDGFNLKENRKDEEGKAIAPYPYHYFSKDKIVKIIGVRREEYICEYEGMKQNLKRRFVKLI